MRILYIAEIVSRPGIHAVKKLLPSIRKDREIDFVIANGDAVTGGYGIGKNHSIQLRKLGVDVITGGDQIFYKKDMVEHIEHAPYVLRPANLLPDTPGRGWRHYTVRPREWEKLEGVAAGRGDEADASPAGEAGSDASGSNAGAGGDRGGGNPGESGPAEYSGPAVKIAVLSLLGQSGFERSHGNNPFVYFSNVLDRITSGSSAVVVDFHALTTAEKYTMFHHADGKVTAVIGSGQRVQTSDVGVMPGGTAVICDAGRTGSRESVGGYARRPELQQYLTGVPLSSEDGWDDLYLQGVVIDLDLASGYVNGVEAISQHCEAPPPEKRERKKPERARG